MICHVTDCPCGATPDTSRASEPLPPFQFDLDKIDNELLPLLPSKHHSSKSHESVITDLSNNEDYSGSKSPSGDRLSRRRKITEGFRIRATSFKSELSFSKKEKRKSPGKSAAASRRGSNTQSGRNSPERNSACPEESPSSSTSRADSWNYFTSTPSTSVDNSPRSPHIMATRKPSAQLDPAAAQRRRTITESKARTHRMAVEEENALRERMKRNGAEDRFPNYKFIDFIGKGTYGRVYQA